MSILFELIVHDEYGGGLATGLSDYGVDVTLSVGYPGQQEGLFMNYPFQQRTADVEVVFGDQCLDEEQN